MVFSASLVTASQIRTQSFARKLKLSYQGLRGSYIQLHLKSQILHLFKALPRRAAPRESLPSKSVPFAKILRRQLLQGGTMSDLRRVREAAGASKIRISRLACMSRMRLSLAETGE